MKGQRASWYLVALVIVLVALPVLVSVCWPVQEASRPAQVTPTTEHIFVIPTAVPLLTVTPIVAGPPTPHLTATPRMPATPTATPGVVNVVIVPTAIGSLPPTATPDILPLDLPTMRPLPTGGVPPVQAPRR